MNVVYFYHLAQKYNNISISSLVQDRKGSGEEIEHSKENPLRLVDKLNTNHRFVGYIHILFPNALILHCARNPVDAVFSSYKHDFNGKLCLRQYIELSLSMYIYIFCMIFFNYDVNVFQSGKGIR